MHLSSAYGQFFARTDPIIEKNYESDLREKKNEFRPSLGEKMRIRILSIKGKTRLPDPKTEKN